LLLNYPKKIITDSYVFELDTEVVKTVKNTEHVPVI